MVPVVIAELLPALGSWVEEVTVTELVITAPFGVGQLTVATSVMVSDAPAGSELKLTVRLLAEPPHTPLPVEAQETNVTEAGRLSVTTTAAALPVPRLVTVMAQVRFEPATTGLGEAVLLIATSASAVSGRAVRRDIFSDDRDRRRFLQLLEEAVSRFALR